MWLATASPNTTQLALTGEMARTGAEIDVLEDKVLGEDPDSEGCLLARVAIPASTFLFLRI